MTMDGGKAQEYLEVQARTATPDQLLLMLLDGAVRFVEGGLASMDRGDRESRCKLLQKAENIVLELIQSLNPGIGEKLYANLIGLYKFIYRRLVEGNIRDDRKALEEGLKILVEVRETWKQAVEVYRSDLSGPPPEKIPAPGISIQA